MDEKKQKQIKDEDAWNEMGTNNKKIVFRNQNYESQIENSIIRDIFGGVLRTEFIIEGSR